MDYREPEFFSPASKVMFVPRRNITNILEGLKRILSAAARRWVEVGIMGRFFAVSRLFPHPDLAVGPLQPACPAGKLERGKTLRWRDVEDHSIIRCNPVRGRDARESDFPKSDILVSPCATVEVPTVTIGVRSSSL